MRPLRRRTVLAVPALGLALPLLTACSEESGLSPVEVDPTQPVEGRISYGSDPSQFADLYLPDAAPVAVAVVVHGGFWQAQYGLEYGAPLAESLKAHGWAAWNIEYRRVGNGGGVPATLDDVRAAIDKLADLGLDLTTVVGIGHSAGGHLVTWAASGGGLTHVIDQAGVVDLITAYDEGLGGGAVEAFLGHPPTAADAAVDPIQQVPLDVPIWCVHASGDTIVPPSQSEAYVEAATAAGATAELVRVDGDHFAVIDPDSSAWARTLEILDSIAPAG
ncbi:MAG: prolyl oligopeptidase family serine peptidase [Actinobacteria bacterium]|nr:prolyl oligopeptidase family serine peptidase [Actinomycetota bacterium]